MMKASGSISFTASFTGKEGTVTFDGFYDGDGVYKARFMPSYEGEYTFTISGSFSPYISWALL